MGKMASLTLLLLHVLLMVSTASAWRSGVRSSPRYVYTYRFFGGSLIFSSAKRNSDGTIEVDIRNKETNYNCYLNGYTCSGNCGRTTHSSQGQVSRNSFGFNWCESEFLTKRKLSSNRPFQIRFPTRSRAYDGIGYWWPNVRHALAPWKMTANLDLGTRSDTGESNKSPITTMLPALRVTRNCPRWFNITLFDPDGDRVRCRVPTSHGTHECALCALTSGFSLDQKSCSIKYTPQSSTGIHAVELQVEDFPNTHITLSYNDGSYTTKRPLSVVRRKRSLRWGTSTATPATTTTTPATTTTTPATTTTTLATTTTTPATTTTTLATTTTTLATTTTTLATTTTPLYRSSIPPLSKLPLQFSVQVDGYNAASCLDGDFFPIFLSPTPSNGVNLPAYVNHTLEIKVKSMAQFASIIDPVITGPRGISREKISTGEYVIKWTPTDNEVNEHFPICFLSEAKDGNNRVYQSEVRCVIADVGHHETTVTCNETTVTVEVEKSSLIRRNEDSLHLDKYTDSSCNLTLLSNTTHLVASMSLGSCGTRVEEDQENIIFKNSITSADLRAVISRQHDVDIAFSCIYPKRTNLTLGFRHKNPYAFSEKGFGAFTFTFEFFQTQRFRNQVDANTYPVDVYLKQMIYMQIEATTSIPNTELFVESCEANPYDNPNSRIKYKIIENGCVKDRTVQIYAGSRYQFRFGIEAFEFIGDHDEVYITCSVILCEANIPGTRCSQGCIGSGGHRSKREAVAQTSSHSISQGPLHLVKTSQSQTSGLSLNLGANVVFIVGSLLVCAVVIYRSRRSKAKYQPLPTSELD